MLDLGSVPVELLDAFGLYDCVCRISDAVAVDAFFESLVEAVPDASGTVFVCVLLAQLLVIDGTSPVREGVGAVWDEESVLEVVWSWTRVIDLVRIPPVILALRLVKLRVAVPSSDTDSVLDFPRGCNAEGDLRRLSVVLSSDVEDRVLDRCRVPFDSDRDVVFVCVALGDPSEIVKDALFV